MMNGRKKCIICNDFILPPIRGKKTRIKSS
jgi:hypothetical protein